MSKEFFPFQENDMPNEQGTEPVSPQADDLDIAIVRGAGRPPESAVPPEPLIIAHEGRKEPVRPPEPPAEFDRPSEGAAAEADSPHAEDLTPETEYDSIIPTALLTAGWRAYSSLPLSREICDAANRIWEAEGQHLPALFEPEKHAPAFEARQRVTDQIIEESDSTQILDIAAGLTPRGLLLTKQSGYTYVELDLPRISQLKAGVIEQLRQDGVLSSARNQKLFLEAGDGLDRATVQQSARHFETGTPVTVLTEGLLHYLTLPQRDALAQGIGAVLRRSGGIWVTDMPTQEGISEEDRQMAQQTSRLSGRDVARNRFGTHNDAKAFFAARGLVVRELRSFLSVVDDLESPRIMDISPQQVDAITRPWSMWIFQAEP